jgi:dihydropteroate synthase
MNYTLNIRGQLLSLDQPVVMGILNATPDSFYADSRAQTEEAVAQRARQIIDEGAAIIDIGACSTRPGSAPATQQEEMERLRMALGAVRREWPGAVVSVDTFRPDVARMAVEEYGADIINDVGTYSTPQEGTEMRRVVSRLRVPYILMASEPTLRDTLLFFAERVQQLRDMGQKDIILDPGFGFGKTLEENYALLASMEKLLVMELPLLVGVSRKSMIYKLLGCRPFDALNGTTALHTIALMKGASILRVHDVKEAVECCRLVAATMSQQSETGAINRQ